METLVIFRLPTTYEIDLVSMRVVKHHHLYADLLRKSDVDIEVTHKFSGETDTYAAADLGNYTQTSSDDAEIAAFKKIFPNGFNSTESVDIFRLIDDSFRARFGYAIEQDPVYSKYTDLYARVAIAEKSCLAIYNKLLVPYRKKVDLAAFEDEVRRCFVLVEENAVANEQSVVAALERQLARFAAADAEQEEHKKEEVKQKNTIRIAKNRYDQYIVGGTNLIFNPITRKIVGKSNNRGGKEPLNKADFKLCEKLHLDVCENFEKKRY